MESEFYKRRTLTPADVSRVSLRSSRDVIFWARSFDCSETQLILAVAAVGNAVLDVRRCLQRWNDR